MAKEKGNGQHGGTTPPEENSSLFAAEGYHSVLDEFRDYLPKRWDVTPNKNHKTITVSNHLDLNRIKIKVIASYQVWCAMEDDYLLRGLIPLATVELYLSRPQKAVLEAIRRYWTEDPEDASHLFYVHYISKANARNPLFPPARKPRGGNIHCPTPYEMYTVRLTARHLYVVLQYWLRKPVQQWPAVIRGYLARHNLLKSDKHVVLDGAPVYPRQDQICKLVRWVLNEHFSISLSLNSERNFYERHILWKPLAPLKNAYRTIGFQIAREPLQSVFSS